MQDSADNGRDAGKRMALALVHQAFWLCDPPRSPPAEIEKLDCEGLLATSEDTWSALLGSEQQGAELAASLRKGCWEEAIQRLCEDAKATTAATDKRQRTDGDEGKASPANSLRLVRRSNLPRPVELLVLSFLPFTELHTLSELSNDMGRLVQTHFASLRSFSLHDPDWIVGTHPELRCVWSALLLLQHCRQLQHLSLRELSVCKHDKLHPAACSVIARNAMTLETCGVDTTLVHMALLAQCPRLTKFDDVARHLPAGKRVAAAYNAAALHITSRCRQLTLLNLRLQVLTQQTLSAILHAGLDIKTLTTAYQLNDLQHLTSLESLHVFERDVGGVPTLLKTLSRLHTLQVTSLEALKTPPVWQLPGSLTSFEWLRRHGSPMPDLLSSGLRTASGPFSDRQLRLVLEGNPGLTQLSLFGIDDPLSGETSQLLARATKLTKLSVWDPVVQPRVVHGLCLLTELHLRLPRESQPSDAVELLARLPLLATCTFTSDNGVANKPQLLLREQSKMVVCPSLHTLKLHLWDQSMLRLTLPTVSSLELHSSRVQLSEPSRLFQCAPALIRLILDQCCELDAGKLCEGLRHAARLKELQLVWMNTAAQQLLSTLAATPEAAPRLTALGVFEPSEYNADIGKRMQTLDFPFESGGTFAGGVPEVACALIAARPLLGFLDLQDLGRGIHELIAKMLKQRLPGRRIRTLA